MEVTENIRLAERWFSASGQLDGKKPLMNFLAQAVNHPSPVEVYPARGFMLEGMKTSAMAERFCGFSLSMPTNRLEERMAWRDPFEIVFFRLSPDRSSSVDTGLPEWAGSSPGPADTAEATGGVRSGSNVKGRLPIGLIFWGTRAAASRKKRAIVSGTTRLSWARARRSISISRLRLLVASPLQGVLANGPESALVHIVKQSCFQVEIA